MPSTTPKPGLYEPREPPAMFRQNRNRRRRAQPQDGRSRCVDELRQQLVAPGWLTRLRELDAAPAPAGGDDEPYQDQQHSTRGGHPMTADRTVSLAPASPPSEARWPALGDAV